MAHPASARRPERRQPICGAGAPSTWSFRLLSNETAYAACARLWPYPAGWRGRDREGGRLHCRDGQLVRAGLPAHVDRFERPALGTRFPDRGQAKRHMRKGEPELCGWWLNPHPRGVSTVLGQRSLSGLTCLSLDGVTGTSVARAEAIHRYRRPQVDNGCPGSLDKRRRLCCNPPGVNLDVRLS